MNRAGAGMARGSWAAGSALAALAARTARHGVPLLLAAGAIALPAMILTAPGGPAWPSRLLVVTASVTAVLAAMRRSGPAVTAVALQLVALDTFVVVGHDPPGTVVFAVVASLLLTAYLHAMELFALRWPRGQLGRRAWPAALTAAVAVVVVAAVVALPATVSPVAVLVGLAAVVAAYTLALGGATRVSAGDRGGATRLSRFSSRRR